MTSLKTAPFGDVMVKCCDLFEAINELDPNEIKSNQMYFSEIQLLLNKPHVKVSSKVYSPQKKIVKKLSQGQDKILIEMEEKHSFS